jgi:hypothetical protein
MTEFTGNPTGPEYLAWLRALPSEEKRAYIARRTAERQAEAEAREAARQAEHAAWVQNYYSTENLERAAAESGYGSGGAPHPRQSRVLLRLDTVERRKRAMAEAGTRQNLMGGILSANLHHAVNDMLAAIAAGREDQELYGERTARQYRERENEAREAQMAAAAAAFARRRQG